VRIAVLTENLDDGKASFGLGQYLGPLFYDCLDDEISSPSRIAEVKTKLETCSKKRT
jgi:hypothetical protein